MSTVEQIAERAKALPESLQTEALHFVNYLLSIEDAKVEAADWSAFAGAQLAKQYGPGDEVYDRINASDLPTCSESGEGLI